MMGRMYMFNYSSRQSGAVLISGLLILVVLTIISISSIQTTQMEERMAANYRARTTAFEGAEAALLAAESFLTGSVSTLDAFDNDGSDGLYDNSVDRIWENVNWTATTGTNLAVQVAGFDSAYVIEHFGTFDADQATASLNIDNYGNEAGAGVGAVNKQLFRITARGTDTKGVGQVFIQVTYELEL
ncbi:MAG: PilX N-terminal domain-containing pilus assembly protein [Sedimenticola sp.]